MQTALKFSTICRLENSEALLSGWRVAFFFCFGICLCPHADGKDIGDWPVSRDIDGSHKPLVPVYVKKVVVFGVSDIGSMNDLIFHCLFLLWG